MRNYTFYVILFLLLPVLYCDAKPKVQFQETVYNFGTVKQETSVKHTFIFKNTGNSILAIERVKAG